MNKTGSIAIQRVAKSRLSEVDLHNLEFGKLISDHMALADYSNGKCSPAQIVPYGKG
jgi:branched-chain amino acid aminotransferase